MFTWYKELSVLLKCITCSSPPLDIELSNIGTVRELLSIRDKVLICPIGQQLEHLLIIFVFVNYFSFVITSAYCCVWFDLCVYQLLLFLCNC